MFEVKKRIVQLLFGEHAMFYQEEAKTFERPLELALDGVEQIVLDQSPSGATHLGPVATKGGVKPVGDFATPMGEFNREPRPHLPSPWGRGSAPCGYGGALGSAGQVAEPIDPRRRSVVRGPGQALRADYFPPKLQTTRAVNSRAGEPRKVSTVSVAPGATDIAMTAGFTSVDTAHWATFWQALVIKTKWS